MGNKRSDSARARQRNRQRELISRSQERFRAQPMVVRPARKSRPEGIEDRPLIPVWEYPAVGDDGVPAGALDVLRAVPIRMMSEDGITDISLQQLAQESQTTVDDVLEHFAALHEIGSLQWDSDLKTHMMTIPDDSTGADAASPTRPAAL